MFFMKSFFFEILAVWLLFFHVVSATEEFLQPAIEDDEEVAGTHLAEFELGHTAAAVPPGDRNGGP